MLIENMMQTTRAEEISVKEKENDQALVTVNETKLVSMSETAKDKIVDAKNKFLKSENLLKATVAVSCLGIVFIILKK